MGKSGYFYAFKITSSVMSLTEVQKTATFEPLEKGRAMSATRRIPDLQAVDLQRPVWVESASCPSE
jgi:hypothetical protein